MRILLVSQMYPGPDAPDYGVFVRQMEDALRDRGHDLDRAILTYREPGRRKYAILARRAETTARRFKPDVVYAHFLVPTGLLAGLASRAPLVVTAHGQDVANARERAPIRAATRLVAKRAAAVIAVSDYLRRDLEATVPEARGKTHVVNSGVDLERFHSQDATTARTAVGWDGEGPALVCIGSLTERKNVVRLADAFRRTGRGRLAFVGDGPLRPLLEGRPGVTLVGRVAHDDVPDWIAAADVVCQPSLIEPFGQAILEAMASERSVVATKVGGPPEFVRPEAGVLVNPADVDDIAAGLKRAAALGTPNEAARRVAARHDVRLQAAKVEAILEQAVRRRLGGAA